MRAWATAFVLAATPAYADSACGVRHSFWHTMDQVETDYVMRAARKIQQNDLQGACRLYTQLDLYFDWARTTLESCNDEDLAHRIELRSIDVGAVMMARDCPQVSTAMPDQPASTPAEIAAATRP